MAQDQVPDLIVLDVMMPQMDGVEVCNRLRGSFTTRHIPVIMVTARAGRDDRMAGLTQGANDYVTKPFDMRELVQRVRNTLDWSRQQRSASPLTGLPGNHSINAEIRRRLGIAEPFALMQMDIDHFKAFNDYYGYGRGDEAIQLLARILTESVHRVCGAEGFVGHIGGDDFVALCPCDDAETLGEEILAWFNTARLHSALGYRTPDEIETEGRSASQPITSTGPEAQLTLNAAGEEYDPSGVVSALQC